MIEYRKQDFTEPPYVETHIVEPYLIVDIRFMDETIKRGVVAYSLEFDSGSHKLVIYKDMPHKNKETYYYVERIEVIGLRKGGR